MIIKILPTNRGLSHNHISTIIFRMQSGSIDQFWREKEKKRGGDLVIASSARYLGDGAESSPPVFGLLSIMTNGIYFETFQDKDWWRGVFRSVFKIPKDFTKIDLGLKREQITDVTCFRGQKDRFRFTVLEKLKLLLGILPRRLLVDYRKDGRLVTMVFLPDKPPLEMCAAFHILNKKRFSTSATKDML